MSLSVWKDVAAGEYGVSIFALFILSIICLVAVKRRKDPLRKPLLYLKWAIPVFFLFAVCMLVITVLSIVTISNYNNPYLGFEIMDHISPAASFFSGIADILILLCIVELAMSFRKALGKDRHVKVIRYATCLVMAILAILSIAALGLDEEYATKVFKDHFEGNASWVTVSNIYGAWNIIYWIVSLAVVALSAIVLHNSIRQRQLRSLTRRHFATAVLNLTRTTWYLYMAIMYEINYKPRASHPYMIILDPILYSWVTIAMYGLLVSIGIKKRGGLWSEGNNFQQQHAFVGNPNAPYPPAAEYGRYNLYQQPAQAEVFGSAPPVWRELAAPGPQQQQYHPHYQQQQPFLQQQNQMGHAVPVEAGSPPSGRVEMDMDTQQVAVQEVEASNGGVGGRVGWHRWPSHHPSLSPQPTHIYEVAGTRDQKN